MVEADVEAPAGVESAAERSLCHVMVHMRRLMIVAFIGAWVPTATWVLGSSFLRTIVHCAPPLPDEQGRCPSGSFLSDGRCEAALRGSGDWSFSDHCADKAYVLHTATEYQGNVVIANRAAALVGVTVFGPQLDIWGRKPLIVLTLATYLIGGALVLASTYVADASSQMVLIVASATVPNVFDVSAAAFKAMVADMSRSTALDRSRGFSAIQLVGSVGKLIALFACTFILSLNLAEYRPVWFLMCLLVALCTSIAACVLRETLPKESKLATPGKDGTSLAEDADSQAATPAASPGRLLCPRMGSPAWAATRAVQDMCLQVAQAGGLTWKDPLLGHISVIIGVLGGTGAGILSTMGSYLLEALHYTQAMTQIPAAVYPLIGLVSVCLCPRFVKCYGPVLTAELGMLLIATGFALFGLSVIFMEAANTLFWLGFCTTSFGSSFPPICLQSMLSTRVNAYSQGKLDSLVVVVGLVFSMVGSYLWTHCFYSGWRSGLIFWPGTAVALATMLWFALAYRRWPEAPMDADGA